MISITLSIIIITCIISISGFSSQKIIDDLIFYPPAVSERKQFYRFITCGFIHADIAHLGFNMISLYFFGDMVQAEFEKVFNGKGEIFYALLYISALVVCLLPSYAKNKNNSFYRSLGASGAVSAIVFAGIVLHPAMRLGFFIIPPIIPGFIFGPLYLIISAYLEKRGGDNVNHSAHIWGAIYGAVFLIFFGKFIGDKNILAEFLAEIQYYFQKYF